MGCHFLPQCMKVKSESEVTQSCPTLCDPMDCSPPGSSVHGIRQARVLEWVAIAFSYILLLATPNLAFSTIIILFFLPFFLSAVFPFYSVFFWMFSFENVNSYNIACSCISWIHSFKETLTPFSNSFHGKNPKWWWTNSVPSLCCVLCGSFLFTGVDPAISAIS